MSSNRGFLARAHKFLIYFGGVYVAVLALATIPAVQKNLIYMHRIPFPLKPKFDLPQKYGLAPFKALNLHIPTADNETLGAWFIFSDPYFQAQSFQAQSSHAPASQHGRLIAPLTTSNIHESIAQHPTIIFFHGNAANRAAPYRVALYSALSTRLQANVLAIDYRGFGDSTGSPSENGLRTDANAAWDWVKAQGASDDKVVIMGHSLGSAVAAMLAEDLVGRDVRPKGVVLVSPFSSLITLTQTYKIFGFLPLLSPLSAFPGVLDRFQRFLVDRMHTVQRLPSITSSLLIIHSVTDMDIPSTHSLELFETILEAQMPPLPLKTLEELTGASKEQWEAQTVVVRERAALREQRVSEWDIEGFGKVSKFKRCKTPGWQMDKWGHGYTAHLETLGGGHVKLLGHEAVIDFIGDFMELR